MLISKISSLIIVFIIFHLNIFSQNPADYSGNWKTVEALEKKGLTASALSEVIKIFNAANASKNDAQLIKSAMYQMKYRNLVEEDNQENNIFFIDTLIEQTNSPAKNILQSMQAELFQNYRQNNRYKIYDRTTVKEEKSNDIETWGSDKLNNTIETLYKASLKNEAVLKTTSLNGLDAIIRKGQNTRNLRPTLYDFLAHRALDYFMDAENDITSPAYKFILNDQKIFAPAEIFLNVPFNTRDTASLYYNALILFRDILRFHINDKSPDAFIDADLKRLEFVNQHGIFQDKDKLYEQALKNIETKNLNHRVSAQAMYLRASIYYKQGSQYKRLAQQNNQFDIKKAKELCDSAIRMFPGSEGAINAENLSAQIKQPLLNLETEKVNLPGQPFLTLVKYKNISSLHFRIIKTTREEIKKIDRSGYPASWKTVQNLKALKSWNVILPGTGDYQEHAVEIKIAPVPQGVYFILASVNADFSLSKNIIARQVIYCSNISYIKNNKDEIYILNRDNGQPLPKAELQIWQQTYNPRNENYEEIKKEKYIADDNGFIKLKKEKDYVNNSIQVKFNKEELFTDDQYYTYNYNSYENPSAKKTFLFTDRSIYRPGQTIFFKGIVVNTDSASKKSTVINGYRTTVNLFDANQQKLSTLHLETNEYGSYNGSFKLPEGILNGQFYLSDSVNQSAQYFSVEEYKRPRFFVEIKKPEGTYRLNDSISVKGFAKAYAGNNIDAAKLIYRVVRKVRYPIWWGWGNYSRIWPPYGNREAMEITNGEATTNADGEFYITFKAIPEEATDKKDQPVFYYEISADVTDINGETRSGNTSVAVAYQAIQLDIIAPEKMPSDSLKNIKINSRNLNDLFEKVSLNLTIHKLQSPARIFREKYWEVPDQFIMNQKEFYANFPYDAYHDEAQMSKWALEQKVADITDTTSSAGSFNIKYPHLAAGWYKIIAITKDKYGEEAKAEKYIRITDKDRREAEDPIVIDVKNNAAEPGQKINYSISTGFKKIWLIHNLAKADRSSVISYYNLSKENSLKNEIEVSEHDRGGINLGYAFVQHNRVYSGNENFIVPWSNKDLDISFETFRDKTLPGSEEKWKIKIKGNKAEKVAAEALLSMYDASLDQFKTHSWALLKSLWPLTTDVISWSKNVFVPVNSLEYNFRNNDFLKQKPKSYDALLNNGWNERFYERMNTRFSLQRRVSGIVAESAAAPMMDRAANFQEVVVSSFASTKKGEYTGNSTRQKTDSIVRPVKNDMASFQNENVQVRKNFNETAFFFPALTTDADGNIQFSFTMPEALTQWKLMTLAHSKDLASSYAEKTIITSKPLMVQPNTTRFLREGDRMELSAKIVNLSDSTAGGTVQLELFNAETNRPVDSFFKNISALQNFSTPAGKSSAIKFPVNIPVGYTSALTWRIKVITKDGKFTDGEEASLPVLSNRMLVTEAIPLNMRNATAKNFRFEKLLSSGGSGTLINHALTVEYTANPSWYAVQALPFLMEYPYECAEQNFNRYYANTLASFISNSRPRIKAIFDKWKTFDTAALMSNLQKNQELKSVLLEETPWVLEAQNESQQKKNIALLFDMTRMAREKENTLNKLKEMQTGNGGFPWFRGGEDDCYITQYIITGIGHLRKLNAISPDDFGNIKPLVEKALPYLDAKLKEEYDRLIRDKVNLKENHLSHTAIQYIYMRSFFKEYKINSKTEIAYSFYYGQAKKFWLNNNRYMQAMIALTLFRTGDNNTAVSIIKSLKENAIYNEEMGMYWKDISTGGFYWYQAPVESHAMMIEAFTDIDRNQAAIDDLKTWLLKQKQTQNWRTTKATADACYALLLNGSSWIEEEKTVTISLGNTVIESDSINAETGTGYFKKSIAHDKIQQGMGNITVKVSGNPDKPISASTGWGAVYWQYFEDLDKINFAATPLKLTKNLFIEKNSDKGPVLQALKDNDKLTVGDKIKVRIELKADRDMEYIHMKDMRAACMEPSNVLSGYRWQGGLRYYETTRDASTNFFFDRLPRGTYVFEYPMFVTHTGNFSNGITTIQCMYAPEFTSHSNGIRVDVESK